MKKNDNKGVLYLVSTPIGNLKDITIRALETLRGVDFVAAEDMKRAKKLLSAYNIKGRIIGYREENRERAAKAITGKIDEGKNVALISDAGTPALSDPGDHLIKKCIEKRIPVVPVPGVSSIICALTVSGLDISEFSFLGFLERKGKKRADRLLSLARDGRTTVIFESPKRIVKTLTDILDVVGDRDAAVCRELTKLHEEVIRGTVSEIIGELQERGEIKGEVVLIVSGSGEEKKGFSRDVVAEKVKKYVKENPGKKTKEVAKILAAELGVSVRDIYEMAVKEREN